MSVICCTYGNRFVGLLLREEVRHVSYQKATGSRLTAENAKGLEIELANNRKRTHRGSWGTHFVYVMG